ncbi:hypothetical protein NMG60_11015361 [Bertholletia excelsa]
MASSSLPAKIGASSDDLPVKKIPGGYGVPFFGPIKDRYSFFYTQGEDEFFTSRIEKYKSTVFRTNMPPGPFIADDPRVIALEDAVSFQVLFDTSKVEKKNVFVGTFMPSTAFYGGFRPCAYLDPSEPTHALLKRFFFSLIAKWKTTLIPTFQSSMAGLFTNIEDNVSKKGEADFNSLNDKASFEFAFKLFCETSPSDTVLGSDGPKLVASWQFFQLHPLITLGLKFVPNFLEDLVLHTFPFPPWLEKSGYKKIYKAFYDSMKTILDEAERSGLKRDEACHNLVFLACFNTYGGAKVLFPGLLKWVGAAGEALHRRLAQEIRNVVNSEGGVTLSALEKMPLVKSVSYEALRIEPPVPFQYGKAKEDMVVRSHDAAFEVKKGEMLFGYQPIATKDPKVFDDPEEFVPDRFIGDGEKLLKYVYWSNGRETENPTAEDKQCAGKDLVVLMSRLMLVEFFLRYDTFTCESGKFLLGSSVTIKSLTKASPT